MPSTNHGSLVTVQTEKQARTPDYRPAEVVVGTDRCCDAGTLNYNTTKRRGRIVEDGLLKVYPV